MSSNVQSIKCDLSRASNKNSQISFINRLEPLHGRTQSYKDKVKILDKMKDENAIEMPLVDKTSVAFKENGNADNKDGQLYERNKQSEVFMLLLSGKVDICSGKDVIELCRVFTVKLSSLIS